MIQISTILQIADNTGARLASCISLPKEAMRNGASIGTVVRGSVKRILVKQNLKKSRVLKKGQITNMLIVRTIYRFKR